MEKQNNFSNELYKLNKVLSRNFASLSKKKRKIYIYVVIISNQMKAIIRHYII